MVFENIKETVAAFQAQPAAIESSQIQASERPRLGVLLLVGMPITFVLAYALTWFVNLIFGPLTMHASTIDRVIDIVTSLVVSYTITIANLEAMRRLPLTHLNHLNPYFGRHLEETIGAFKKQ